MHIFVTKTNVETVPIEGRYFFDTNVWLTLIGPYANFNNTRTKVYSAIRRRIRQNGAIIVTDTNVISEFINRYSRLIHDDLRRSNKAPYDYKEFRKSSAYQQVGEEISAAVKTILNACTVIPVDLPSRKIDEISCSLGSGESDFNDHLIVHSCSEQALTLVTHDGDFLGMKISIISANQAYETVNSDGLRSGEA